ncbi:MurR/RpiR family transcriptional regulator [Streptomyces sp. NPDC001617]
MANLISDRSAALRPAERKVARVLMTDYPTAGLGTAASLAAAAGVSAPSVVRFATALGFEGFNALQAALKSELRLHSEGPLGQIAWEPVPGSKSELLVQRAQTMTKNAVRSLKKIPSEDLDNAIALLSDTSRKLYLSGGRYSSILAKDLTLNLETIRPKVRHLDDPYGTDLSTIMALSRRDVYVIFDFHRYQQSTVDLARQVRRRGSTIILVTDEQLSPAVEDAQVVLPVSVTSPAPFVTFSAGIILMELLALEVLHKLGDRGRQHLTTWETVRGRELISSSEDEPGTR